jgi:hypothetical protein
MNDATLTRADVIEIARQNNRVCPLPQQWTQLYELLPDKRRAGNGWEPSLPLVLAAWHDSSAMAKMLRLQEHIEWAELHGSLADAAGFLAALPEDQWLHIGE